MQAVSRGVRHLGNRWRPGVHTVNAPVIQSPAWQRQLYLAPTMGQDSGAGRALKGGADILSDAALTLAGIGLIAQSEGDSTWNWIGIVTAVFGGLKLFGDIAVIQSK